VVLSGHSKMAAADLDFRKIYNFNVSRHILLKFAVPVRCKFTHKIGRVDKITITLKTKMEIVPAWISDKLKFGGQLQNIGSHSYGDSISNNQDGGVCIWIFDEKATVVTESNGKFTGEQKI